MVCGWLGSGRVCVCAHQRQHREVGSRRALFVAMASSSPLIAYAAVARAGATLADWSPPASDAAVTVPAALAADVVAALDCTTPSLTTDAYVRAGWLWTASRGGGLAVVAATAVDAPRAATAAFLATVRECATDAAGGKDFASLPPYSLDTALTPLMAAAAAAADASRGDATARAARELEAAKAALAHSVDAALARGERLTDLVGATDALASRARDFGASATTLRRAEAWRAVQARVAIGVVVCVVVYGVAAAVCGLALGRCRL